MFIKMNDFSWLAAAAKPNKVEGLQQAQLMSNRQTRLLLIKSGE